MKLIIIGSLVSFAFSLFIQCAGLPSLSKTFGEHEPRPLEERSFEEDGSYTLDSFASSGQLGDTIPFRSRSFSKRGIYDSHPVIVARGVAPAGPTKELTPTQQPASNEYTMKRDLDLKKPTTLVYAGPKVVAYTIKSKWSTKSFEIVNSAGKPVLKASPVGKVDCAHFSYASTPVAPTDKAVTFTQVGPAVWSIKLGTNVYTYSMSATDNHLREIKDANGRVDTTVRFSVAGEGELAFEWIRTITRTPSSQCPLESVIGLLVAISEWGALQC